MNIFKEITTTPLTQDSPTGSISKRSSRSCKKERERTVMNVLRETHPPQTRKNSPIDFISKRIQKSPSPRDPFLQKRKETENVNERSQRQPPPYQPKIYLPVLFLREAGNLQVQEIHSYKKEH